MAEIAAVARGEDPEEGLERSFKSVDTCAAEFEAETPYFYSGWERAPAHEIVRGDRASVVILGARARTGSARASSSTTAASTRR